jgi:fused signal recognition particle receptor
MFEGLKDSLGRFRRDVEEEVDEDIDEEPGEEATDEGTAEGKPAGDGEIESGASADIGSEAEPADESRTRSGSEPGSEIEAGTRTEPETGADAGTGTERESDPAVTAETKPAAGTVGAEADRPAEGAQDTGGAGETETTETGAVSTADADPGPPDAPAESEEGAENGEDGRGPSFGTRAMAFATGQAIIHKEDLEDPLWNLEMALLESDVELSVAESILDGVRERLVNTRRAQVKSTGMVVEDALGKALVDVISVGQFDFDERVASADKPVVIAFTGVNGVGKTTSIAKLARYFEGQGLSCVLANGDTYRAGANEQIAEHAKRLDKKLIAHESGGDPAAVLYDGVEYARAHDIDVVLGDTAGRLHTSNDLMAQLEKIDRVVDPDMTLFVDEAVAGQDAVRRATEFDDAAAIDGTVLTKADADSQGGAAISIAHVTGKPILFLGIGQEYDHLEKFDPERLVNRLLGAEE